MVATIAAAVARKPRADPRQYSAASCPRGREYLAENPIRILFLPPYSPHMNPIEKLWATIKQQWRQRRVRGFPPLQATLQADLQQIVEKSGKAIVARCGYSSVLVERL